MLKLGSQHSSIDMDRSISIDQLSRPSVFTPQSDATCGWRIHVLPALRPLSFWLLNAAKSLAKGPEKHSPASELPIIFLNNQKASIIFLTLASPPLQRHPLQLVSQPTALRRGTKRHGGQASYPKQAQRWSALVTLCRLEDGGASGPECQW